MKRYRHPKCKEGELKLYYGKIDGSFDVIVAWNGESSMKRDKNLVMNLFASQKPDLFAKPLFSVMNPSFVDELVARGYDISTIKFSIMKSNGSVNDE